MPNGLHTFWAFSGVGKEFGVQLLPVKVQYNDAQEENTTREIILLNLNITRRMDTPPRKLIM